jgi:DNA-3-methyladenine glycosylase II
VGHDFFCHESGGNSMAVIRDERDIAEGLAALIDLDPALRPVIEAAGPVPLRLSEPGFAGLAHIIVSQMVSKASANAIWLRMLAQGPVTPQRFLAHAPEVVAGFGLSRAKTVTISSVAQSIVDGELDLAQLGAVSTDEAMARLVALKGIGPWTAEVYLMFCLGARDIFPVGDVALRAALGHAFAMQERPSLTLTAERAALWRPWRSVAARLFWAYYAREMRRDALPVT